MGNKIGGSLLNILVETRTVTALNRKVEKSRRYQAALKRQDRTFEALNDKSQNKDVDNAISIANDCGTAYGALHTDLD